MNIIQVAKYYKPLQSARALQASKLTDALNAVGITTNVVYGLKRGNNRVKENGLIPVEYSDVLFGIPKFDKVVKEIKQLTLYNDWVKKAIYEIESLLAVNSDQIILTQSTPFECHLIGYYFKLTRNVKWVAFFSDPFPVSISPPPYRGSNYIPFIKILQKAKLKRVLENCDSVLVSSYQAYKLMSRFSSRSLDNNYSIVPHIGMGSKEVVFYDDMKGWIVHTGKLTKERVFDELFTALINLKNSNSKFKGIQFIGTVSKLFKEKVNQMGLQDFVLFKDKLSQDMIYRYVNNCSGLLVIEAKMDESPFLPSKFADYATLGRPILAITPKKSQIRNYLNKYGGGIASCHDSKEIEDSLNEIVEEKHEVSSKLMSYFSYQNVGLIYKDILKKVKC